MSKYPTKRSVERRTNDVERDNLSCKVYHSKKMVWNIGYNLMFHAFHFIRYVKKNIGILHWGIYLFISIFSFIQVVWLKFWLIIIYGLMEIIS